MTGASHNVTIVTIVMIVTNAETVTPHAGRARTLTA